jgi:hypothetical protein
MLTKLGAYPENGAYFLTAGLLPATRIDDAFFEYHAPHLTPRLVAGAAGATPVSRFEFLAHLAALGESALYRVGDVVVAVRGFAGPQGWAFEHGLEGGSRRSIVRIATRSERDAEGTQVARKIERSSFVAEASRLPDRYERRPPAALSVEAQDVGQRNGPGRTGREDAEPHAGLSSRGSRA